jgi:hypothetical protein
MTIFVIVIFGLVACAAALMTAMLRRGEPMFGLVALMIALIAGLAGVVYAGLDSG